MGGPGIGATDRLALGLRPSGTGASVGRRLSVSQIGEYRLPEVGVSTTSIGRS